MFFAPRNFRHPEFRVGALAIVATAPGMAAWGMMTGVAMVQSGMSALEALAMTLLVFAGSSQLAAIPLIAAGAPMWISWATAFCVNLRFVVFSAHLRPYMLHLPLWQRLVSGYLTTDLSYVFFTRHFVQPVAPQDWHTPAGQAQLRAQEAALAGNCGVMWCAWMLASFVGIGLAHAIPLRWGLGFAGILALVGVLCSIATTRMQAVSATVAACAALAAFALPLKLNVVVAIAAAVAFCTLLEHSQAALRTAPNKAAP